MQDSAPLVIHVPVHQTFPEAPYYNGRWSNGPTWIEVASAKMGVSLTDYGAGGATTGSAPARECNHLKMKSA